MAQSAFIPQVLPLCAGEERSAGQERSRGQPPASVAVTRRAPPRRAEAKVEQLSPRAASTQSSQAATVLQLVFVSPQPAGQQRSWHIASEQAPPPRTPAPAHSCKSCTSAPSSSATFKAFRRSTMPSQVSGGGGYRLGASAQPAEGLCAYFALPHNCTGSHRCHGNSRSRLPRRLPCRVRTALKNGTILGYLNNMVAM
jgi:hypothetical protein